MRIEHLGSFRALLHSASPHWLAADTLEGWSVPAGQVLCGRELCLVSSGSLPNEDIRVEVADGRELSGGPAIPRGSTCSLQ